MPTVIYDPQPGEITELIAKREQLGLDRNDEIWNGVYHMMPPPTREHEKIVLALTLLLVPLAEAEGLDFGGGAGVGDDPQNFRVPDIVFHRPGEARSTWTPSAALAVEVLSPNDTAPHKLDFYAAHGVGELLSVDPPHAQVSWLGLDDGRYRERDTSALLGLTAAAVATELGW